MNDHKFRPQFAHDIAARAKPSSYPSSFAQKLNGRSKRQLGDEFGITAFGVNLTTLPPEGQSALMHRHSHQEEFVFILRGNPTLRTEHGEFELAPGMCVGFSPSGAAHHLVNRSGDTVEYLEVGNRPPGDGAEYPEDDLMAVWSDEGWRFSHKDGAPWE